MPNSNEADIIRAIQNTISAVLREPSPRLTDPEAGGGPIVDPVAEESQAIWAALDEMESAAGAIESAANIVDWTTAFLEWRDRLVELADAIVEGRAGSTARAVDDLVVRILMDRYSGIASFMTWIGLITSDPDPDNPDEMIYNLHWEEIVLFLTEKVYAFLDWYKDMFLLALLHIPPDAPTPPPPPQDAGRSPSVFAALFLMARRALPLFPGGDLRIAGLPFPPIKSDPAAPWTRFRQNSSEWVSLTIPLRPDFPQGQEPFPDDAWVFDLVSDAEPARTFTLAIRSNRYQTQAGDWVSDFELWLYFEPEMEEAFIPEFNDERPESEHGFALRVAPATLLGFGYDGATGSWNSHVDPNSQFLPARPDDPVIIEYASDKPADQPALFIGHKHETHVIAKELYARLKLYRMEPFFEAGARARDFSIVLAPNFFKDLGLPKFLIGSSGENIRNGARFDLQFEFLFVPGAGLTVNAASGLEALWVINRGLWGFKLHSLRLGLELYTQETTTPEGDTEISPKLRAIVRAHFSFRRWILTIVVDGVGVWFGKWGNEEALWGIEAWQGFGLAVEDKNVRGGGFLYRVEPVGLVREQFGGVFYLKIGDIEVTAYGIYEVLGDETKSLIILIGALFQPGIPVGFGFKIVGMGGLLGMNRRADRDALWQRLSIGGAGSLFTVKDPVAEAPMLLGEMRFLFPATDGVHIFGPTVRLTWGTTIQLDLALIIEFATNSEHFGQTGPTKIVIFGTGSIKRKVDKKKLIDLNMDVVGLIDFVRDLLSFDATLFKSTVLDVFKATGTVAARMSWGSRPYLMMTVGGFHPKYDPEPAIFPKLERIGLAYKGEGSDRLTLRAEYYQAYTSNSIQVGAKAEAKIKAGRITAQGIITYDALIQFFPFYFDISFSVKIQVKYKSRTLAGITMEGSISGPGPISIYGKFCIEILFFDICWSDTFQIGTSVAQVVETVASLLDYLLPELDDPDNVKSDGRDDGLVIVNTSFVAGDVPVLPPFGGLVWSQQRSPLDCLIDRVEGALLDGAEAVIVTVINHAADAIQDWFSPGSFRELNDAEALNQPAFERLQSGVQISFGEGNSDGVGKDLDVNIYFVPDPTPMVVSMTMAVPAAVAESVDGRTAAKSDFKRAAPAIKVRSTEWAVWSESGLPQAGGISQTDAHQRARLAGAVAVPVGDVITLNI